MERQKELCSMDSSEHSDRKIQAKSKSFLFIYFTVRVVKHKNKVAQRSCGLPVLGETQNTNRAGTGQPALAGSAASRAGLSDLRGVCYPCCPTMIN